MECAICLDNIKDKMKTLPCHHSFCKKCIYKWLKSSNTCPCCRKKIKMKCNMCRQGCNQCRLNLINISDLLNEIDEYFHNKNNEELRTTLELLEICRSI